MAPEEVLRYYRTRSTLSFICYKALADLTTQAPYTDPATGLRYHDKSVYEVVRNLVCRLESLSSPTQQFAAEREYCERISVWWVRTTLQRYPVANP